MERSERQRERNDGSLVHHGDRVVGDALRSLLHGPTAIDWK